MRMKDMIDVFKALSNETRLQILMWLRNPEKNFPPQGEHLSEDVDHADEVVRACQKICRGH